MEKKSPDLYVPDSSNNTSGGGDIEVDEEAPVIPPSRISHAKPTQQLASISGIEAWAGFSFEEYHSLQIEHLDI